VTVTGIRSATAEDAPALAAIDELTWTAGTSPAPYDPDRPFFGERTTPDDVLVAEVDGRVVGYLTLQQALPVPAHAHVLTVNGLAVHPSAAGKGVGRALVAEALRVAVARGARKVTLRVLGPNVAARRLYESCGFVVEGLLEGEFLLDGAEVDDVLMAWRPQR
jgi:ribosomal protein S18 acetylase RimI-like enzyme